MNRVQKEEPVLIPLKMTEADKEITSPTDDFPSQNAEVETSLEVVTHKSTNKVIKSKNFSFNVRFLARPANFVSPKNCQNCNPTPNSKGQKLIFMYICFSKLATA